MTKPLRLYLFEDSKLPANASSSSRVSILLPSSNLDNVRPGKVMQLGDSFQIRAGGAGQNNQIRVKYPSAGIEYHLPLTAGGYTSVGLAAEIQGQLIANCAADFSVSYDTSARKFTISHPSSTFDILWNTGGIVVQALAGTMGFSTAADDTGAQTYTSDNEVYVKDYQWITWRLAKAIVPATSCVFFYSTNLTDDYTRIQLCGNETDLGGDPVAWTNGASYVGPVRPATQSEFNDLYVWTPEDDGAGAGLRWWQLGVYRGDEDQATMPALRIGVGGLFESAWFDGATRGRNFHTPWEWSLIGGNVSSRSPDGGGVERGQSRGYVRAVLPFNGWDEDTYRELWRFQHQHDQKPILILADADDLGVVLDLSRGAELAYDRAPEKALYCTIDGDWTSQAAGPEDYRSFTLTARGIPMHPKGS
jgi:hypothetical protein